VGVGLVPHATSTKTMNRLKTVSFFISTFLCLW
jgi:hypothetical protein